MSQYPLAANTSNILRAIGPGILYAAAAVGISHLVQATRAGAYYSFGMTAAILAASLIKYPGLRFGGEYAAATGQSLIHAYIRTGRWAIGLYALSQIFSTVFVVAAVSLVCAALLKSVAGIQTADLGVVVVLMLLCAAILVVGRYGVLERLTKVIVALFTTLIALTVVLIAGGSEDQAYGFALESVDTSTVLFIVALAGFMPTPMDASVLQSLWTCAKSRLLGRQLTQKEVRLDFNVGFVTTVILALCFMYLGAAVLYGSGVDVASNSIGFATQLIRLFSDTIGDWAFPVVGLAALAVMISTLITLLDGYPRIAETIIDTLKPEWRGRIAGFRLYNLAMIVVCAGALLVLALFMKAFAAFIDLTSVLVFLIAPIIAYLNHRAMFSSDVDVSLQPSNFIRYWSTLGIVLMVCVAVVYVYIRMVAK